MLDSIIHILGIVLSCFITNYVLFDFFRKMYHPTYNKKAIYIAVYFIYSIVLCAINLLNFPLLNILTTISAAILIGYFLYGCGKSGIISSGVFMLCVALCEGIATTLLALLYSMWNMKVQNGELYELLYTAMAEVIILAVYRVFIRCLKRREIDELDNKQYAIYFLLPIFSVLNIYTILLNLPQTTSLIQNIMVLFDIVAIIVLNIYVTYLLDFISKNNKLNSELSLLNQHAYMQYHYYSNLEEKYQQSRKLQHDIRNHLQALEQLYITNATDETKRYSNDIYSIIDNLGQKQYANNKVLNIIINDKMQLAQSNDIEFISGIDECDFNFISDMDVTVIFANLLDNAIEASKKVTENRRIELMVDRFNRSVDINISNTIAETPVEKNGDFISSKENHKGLGLQNVKAAVEKYNGDMRTHIEKGMFIVNIIIPY